jgi:hypothetical protein
MVSKQYNQRWEVILACDYGPAGNIRSLSERQKFPVYIKGKTCSNCPNGTKCVLNEGLCG